jgi:AcrR family transcriptional regulator
LETAARGLSRHGYASLVLERVASEAGYPRGALYPLFASKEDLAVVRWVEETWNAVAVSLSRLGRLNPSLAVRPLDDRSGPNGWGPGGS